MTITNEGRKTYICTTPQTVGLDQAGFELLTFIEVNNAGNVGESGSVETDVTYEVFGEGTVQHIKGNRNAGTPTLEVGWDPDDAGQNALRAVSLTKHNYAIKFEYDDMPDGGSTNTVKFNLGLVSRPIISGGTPNDVVTHTFTFMLNQDEIEVARS